MSRLFKPNLIRRVIHTHIKTNIQENNKVIENLIRQQNERLEKIREEISYVGIMLTVMTVTIAWK